MRVDLQPHPGSQAVPAVRIAAEVDRGAAGRLALRYAVTGDVGAILLPEPAPPGHADGLWRHTCFEAFVRAPAEAGYFELNLAPSGRWAVYRFSDYRSGMAPVDEAPPPEFEARRDPAGYSLSASVELGAAMGLLADLPWQIGVSAVIETVEGSKSYWAIAHPPAEPDFHHRDCFALELPPPKQG